jgi:hypothetical protein
LLPGVTATPTKVRLLGGANRSLPARGTEQGLVVTLPAARSNAVCSVLSLDMPTAVPTAY